MEIRAPATTRTILRNWDRPQARRDRRPARQAAARIAQAAPRPARIEPAGRTAATPETKATEQERAIGNHSSSGQARDRLRHRLRLGGEPETEAGATGLAVQPEQQPEQPPQGGSSAGTERKALALSPEASIRWTDRQVMPMQRAQAQHGMQQLSQPGAPQIQQIQQRQSCDGTQQQQTGACAPTGHHGSPSLAAPLDPRTPSDPAPSHDNASSSSFGAAALMDPEIYSLTRAAMLRQQVREGRAGGRTGTLCCSRPPYPPFPQRTSPPTPSLSSDALFSFFFLLFADPVRPPAV